MAEYETVHSVYETVKNTQHVRRPGKIIDVPDEDAERLLELGAIKPVEDEDEVSGDGSGEALEPTDLPERPSNGATKETWRAYLAKLSDVTKGELGELQVPGDATRDRMIEIGDARVTEWNEV